MYFIRASSLAGTPLTEQMTSGTVMTEAIKQAYFIEKKSIKQIAQEYYHDIRTVRKIIQKPESSANSESHLPASIYAGTSELTAVGLS